MEFTEADEALWAQVGKGLSHQIFDRFERFGDAVDEVLGGFSDTDVGALGGLLERMLATESDPRELWAASGAGIAFNDAKSARMTLEMLLEAVKAKR